MRLVIMTIVLLTLSCCSKSTGLEDNSRPFPRNNSVGLRFIDDKGKDALDKIEMKLIGTNTTFPSHATDSFAMVSEEYSYRCFIDGNEVPDTFQINSETLPVESIIKVDITQKRTEEIKTFWLVLNSIYIIHEDISSERLYEFEYRFTLPTLFGTEENSLKVVTKAKNLGRKIYEKVSFNGKEIAHNNANIFDIFI